MSTFNQKCYINKKIGKCDLYMQASQNDKLANYI